MLKKDSIKIEDYGMIMEFYGGQISKCHNLINKRTLVPGHRLLSSPITNLKLKDNHYLTS